jgi:imidazolonepropionase-like amidohydrolase
MRCADADHSGGDAVAARFLKADAGLGTLVAGRLADIIAVRVYPLTDRRAMRDVEVVVRGGRRVR